MIIPNLQQSAKFAGDKFQAVNLAQTALSKTMVVGLEAGQAIPVHHPASDLTMVILSGRATLVGDGEELSHAGPGAMLYSPAGKARGIRADERTVAVVVVSPPPTEADHKELVEHFKKGTWR